MLLSDAPGLDWRQLYRNRAEAGICETDTAAVPLVQLLAVWNDRDSSGGDSGGDSDDEADGSPPTRTEMLQRINRLRRRNGLPPVEPQGWTPDPGVDWRAESDTDDD